MVENVFAERQSGPGRAHQRVPSRSNGGALDEQPAVSAQCIDRVCDFPLWHQHIVGIPSRNRKHRNSSILQRYCKGANHARKFKFHRTCYLDAFPLSFVLFRLTDNGNLFRRPSDRDDPRCRLGHTQFTESIGGYFIRRRIFFDGECLAQNIEMKARVVGSKGHVDRGQIQTRLSPFQVLRDSIDTPVQQLYIHTRCFAIANY